MSKIKQVLRCYAAGKGTKSIASLLDISRNTVKKYINTFNLCGKSIEEVLAMNETDLLTLFNEEPPLRYRKFPRTQAAAVSEGRGGPWLSSQCSYRTIGLDPYVQICTFLTIPCHRHGPLCSQKPATAPPEGL